MAPTKKTSEVVVVGDSQSQAGGARRSGRVKKPTTKYDDDYAVPDEKPSQPPLPRRTVRKRKAAEPACPVDYVDISALHEQVFARMDTDERKEYRGWVELESEPAFFNAMLQDFGATDLKIQEIFALDDASLAQLPKPVYGLVFLYQYTNEEETQEGRQECPDNLWFGNQTTANACATVAMMNIIMNIHAVKYGPELEEFRNKTKALAPPYRGHALDTNDFIRSVHNSVARRTDLLAEDLSLQNKFESASRKKKTPPKKKKAASKKKQKCDLGTYHYIAYVPVDGQVWELDGLEIMPRCIGTQKTNDDKGWLDLARTAIQSRMQQDEYLSFNLLAVCQSPLVTLSQNLAISISTSKALDDVVTGAPLWTSPSPWLHYTDERLAKFKLSRAAILAHYPPPADFEARVSDPGFNFAAAQDLAAQLRAEQEALEAQFVGELAMVEEAVEMVRARRRDYTPAIHQWVQILAKKGVLRRLLLKAKKAAN